MKRVIAPILGALLVTGCVTNPAQEKQHAVAAAKTDFDTCLASADSLPGAAEYRQKAPVVSEISAVDITNNVKPSAKEKERLAVIFKAYAGCRAKAIEAAEKYEPWSAPVMVNSGARNTQAQAALLSGQATWGEYNRARQSADAEFKQELARAQAAAQQQYNQAQAVAAQQRAASAQEDAANQALMMQGWQMMQPRGQIQPRMQTSCQWVGYVWTCN